MPVLTHTRVTAAMVVVIVALASAGVYLLLGPQPPAPFVADLAIVGNGYLAGSSNLSIPFVRLSLVYSSPTSIDPAGLLIQVVCSPACYVPFAQFPNSTAPTVDVRYSSSWFPHWLATSDVGVWTGFTATAMNPDGRVVGGATPYETDPPGAVESGAIFTVTFPIPGFAPEPAVAVLVAYAGHSGSARVSLL